MCCSYDIVHQAPERELSQPAANASAKPVQQEDESCDDGCAPAKEVNEPVAEDNTSAAQESATPAAAAAAAATGPIAEDQETSVEGDSEAAGINDTDVVAATADTPTESVAVTDEDEERATPTEEQLLEAIRGMPASVQHITQLTLKEVRYRLEQYV